MLRSAQLTHRRFRFSTIGDGGTSASRLESSIQDGPHRSAPRIHYFLARARQLSQVNTANTKHG